MSINMRCLYFRGLEEQGSIALFSSTYKYHETGKVKGNSLETAKWLKREIPWWHKYTSRKRTRYVRRGMTLRNVGMQEKFIFPYIIGVHYIHYHIWWWCRLLISRLLFRGPFSSLIPHHMITINYVWKHYIAITFWFFNYHKFLKIHPLEQMPSPLTMQVALLDASWLSFDTSATDFL